MPKANVEICRATTITREENTIVEVNVPKAVLEDADELYDWVETQMDLPDSALRKATDDATWDVTDEDESHEIASVENLSD